MRDCSELMNALPGEDWQRLETWAAIAGLTPIQYIARCIERGHAVMKEELRDSRAELRPGGDAARPL